ncbi:MAG TPA: glycosyltransferase [Fibrobacteria bacterium]|nr:glycosyltransferase [Fibrobacteria bacterium]
MEHETTDASRFRRNLAEELEKTIADGCRGVPAAEILRMDLHCHDRNSDKPDERLGRMLGVPETWVTTDELLSTLRSNGTDLVTVTNHNNARTCWELLDRGMDVLPGAEFSCTLPDFGVGVHVLAYGFTPAQEERLAALRRDIYRFVDYCSEQDIPTILAHPLQFHSPGGLPPMEVMDRLGLLFERFEVVNGQRDAWQNVLTASWVRGMDEEEVRAMARRARQPVDLFLRRPFRKLGTGGSDDHMAMYAGSTGTLLHVPDLALRRSQGRKASELALESLRNGRLSPYGGANEEEKLAAALLDYFCQVVLNMEDPGLLRILLHKGDTSEKVLALAVANGAMELRRHKVTMRFLQMVHDALRGRSPGMLAQFATNRDFRPLVKVLGGIAKARRKGSVELARHVDGALPELFSRLGRILTDRIQGKSGQIGSFLDGLGQDASGGLLGRMELPAHLRTLIGGQTQARETTASPDLARMVDGLPYPFLAAAVIAGSQYAASRVLHEKRPFLDAFSRRIGKHVHPRRALWLTDTFADRNGVSTVLGQMLEEIRRRDLPIDLLVVSDRLEEGPHLRVVRPVATFEVPRHPQSIRIPDLVAVQKLFHRGGYDRLVCSTEGPMGWVGLYLRNAFEVPAWFFAHTDWMDFARRSLGWDRLALSRLRRMLRLFYRGWDGVFVLNSQMESWLSGEQMAIPAQRLHRTAHWPDPAFSPRPSIRQELFPGARQGEKVLLFVGRLSEEKGLLELPGLLARLREQGVEARLAFAGVGPLEPRLRELAGDSWFLGWCDKERLAQAYSSADFLVFPSRFDTFGCVVVEAMACGLPVAAYAAQGPGDIVQPGQSGILASSGAEMARALAGILGDDDHCRKLREGALRRASTYDAEAILEDLLGNLGLIQGAGERVRLRDGEQPSLVSELVGLVRGA